MTDNVDPKYKYYNRIDIPKSLDLILGNIVITDNKLVMTLDPSYPYQVIIETIHSDFAKLTKNIEGSLRQKGVSKSYILKIVSLIRQNYKKIYPDDLQLSTIEIETNDVNRSKDSKPNMNPEEWLPAVVKEYAELKQVCHQNFPGLWHSLEFELAVLRILNIKECTLPFAGIILGSPSSLKTLGIELLRDSKNVYYTDSFSAKAFVSHATSVPKEVLQDIDLLPRIKNKCILAPELSPIFSKKDDDLNEILGILTRILDGQGYESDSGVHGKRGYSGGHMFVMIGAAVDIPHKVYKYLTNLGPKLYFLRNPKDYKSDDDYVRMLQSNDFNERKTELKEKLNKYLKLFDESCPFEYDTRSGLVKIPFNTNGRGNDRKIFQIIVILGKLLSRLRGNVNTNSTEKTQGSHYGFSTPVVENPERAMTQLRNVAIAHAMSQGRTHLTIEDVPLLIKVVLSTASIERSIIFDLLLNSNGTLTTSQIVKSLNISHSTALKTMTELKVLQLISNNVWDELQDNDQIALRSINEERRITLHVDFEWFLSDEFRELRGDFIPMGKNKFDKDVTSIKKNYPLIQQQLLSNTTVQDPNLETEDVTDSPPLPEIISKVVENEKENKDKSKTPFTTISNADFE